MNNVVKKISSNRKTIKEICKVVNIEPVVYSSIIYAELYNNYNFFDKFDLFRAKIGSDPSVGFSQIKVSTFRWLEDNYSDSSNFISKSNSFEVLLNKITNDTINIAYAAFYISLIKEKFFSKYGFYPSVGIVASYYSKGIDYGKEIFSQSYMNKVGRTADSIFKSNIFQKMFRD